MSNPAPDTTFDLVLMQALNGAYLSTLGENIPASEALAVLREAALGFRDSAGTVPMLIPSTDPLHQVRREVARACALHAPLNSAHEAYAVILEELEEFWGWVKVRRDAQDREAMRAELIQIAAMAIRAVEDLEL